MDGAFVVAMVKTQIGIARDGFVDGSSDLEVERFVAAVAHDLESSLLVLSGNLELLRASGPQLSAEQEDHLERIERTAQRMKRLLAGVRNYAWAGGEAELERVPLGPVLDDCLEMLAQSIAERSVKIEVDGRLPEVTGDRDQLVQLFQNLLSNAIKFSPTGGQVTITTTRRRHAWRIAVSDHGPGIAPEHRDLVFEPFRRLHETGHVPGSGLGLAICMRVAKNHGAALTIERPDGGGATFAVTFRALQLSQT